MNLTTRSDNGSPEPRLAATVVPLRDTQDGLEVLLTIRPKSMRFMGGAAVFPGGAVAPADLDDRWEDLSPVSGAAAAAALGDDDPRSALGAYVAALREAYEEVGLLLVAGPTETLERSDASDAAVFLDECIAGGLRLSTDALVPAGRWVTPMGSPVRFDTRFFVAVVPDGWEPVPDQSEVESCHWIRPQAALDDLGQGELVMAPPTIEMLQRLAAYRDSAEAVASLAADPPDQSRILNARVSPLVRVVLAPNGGLMTGPGTNSYVVGTGPVAIIDPAVTDAEYIDALVGTDEVAHVLVTHRHGDHTGGVSAVIERTGARLRAFGTEPIDGIIPEPLDDEDTIEVGGARLIALHTPGHASDHLCFLLEGVATLFAGDNVAGEGTAVIAPPDGDMGHYMTSLERLRSLDIDRIYPGHFRPLDGGERVFERYIEHRLDRKRAILATLSSGPRSVEDIVAAVYTDTPPALHPIAVYSVLAQLELSLAEGDVATDGDVWRVAR